WVAGFRSAGPGRRAIPCAVRGVAVRLVVSAAGFKRPGFLGRGELADRTERRPDVQLVEELVEVLDAASDGAGVALFLDLRAAQLEVEHALVPGVEELAHDALERDVAIARHETVRCVARADGVVAQLDEPDAGDAGVDGADEV